MKNLLLLVLVIFCSTSALASNAFNVKIERVHIFELPIPAGGVFITISGHGRADDLCPGNDRQYFIDLNEQPRGALLYTQAVTAMNNNYNVNIRGTDQCEGNAKVESISDFQIFR